MAKPLILIIDDDETSRDVISKYLEKTHEIETTPSGITSLKMIKNKQYSMILLDINLGEQMTGLDILKLIREMPSYLNVPVIAVTAYAFEKEKLQFLAAGCDDYISKPFSKKELLGLISRVAERFGVTDLI
ncbi:MAG: response regulator [Ignavibacteriaceae bacterium]|nr:response regulator [Ignavibacteriaceae bacterium]